MGREFGRLSTSVGNRVQFSISPFEQRVFPMASLLSPIPNTIRRVSRSFLLVTIRKYYLYHIHLFTFIVKLNSDLKIKLFFHALCVSLVLIFAF